jgi:hypothetical protein
MDAALASEDSAISPPPEDAGLDANDEPPL